MTTMKTLFKNSLAGLLFLAGFSASAQTDSLGLPGDNLNLKAVLSIFRESSDIEDFEKRLNSADFKVNNLDLNNDNQVDYLRVVDYGKEDFHTIVIQSLISKTESQDVAVIQVVKKGDNTAHIQIVGDELLYGKDYIIEPKDQAPVNTAGSGGTRRKDIPDDDVYETSPASSRSGSQPVMINVWTWPAVSYIYSPGYAYWVSPWYWGYYPGWYTPWRPYGWYHYNSCFAGYHYGFYGYRRHHYAFPHAHHYYHGHRVYSGYVQKNAPHYGRRRDSYDHGGQRISQRSTTSDRSQRVSQQQRAPRETNRNQATDRQTRSSEAPGRSSSGQRVSNTQSGRSSGSDRVSRPSPSRSSGTARPAGSRSGGSSVSPGGGGGSRSSGGGGGGRSSSGGGGVRR
jgi:hypothetical protein